MAMASNARSRSPGAGSALAALLQSAALRRTGTRMQVLEALQAAGQPVTAAEVLERLGQADRVTIYRTLNTLADKRIVHRVQGDDRVWRFALGASQQHEHHHVHFECDTCGTVECLESAPIPDDLSRTLKVDRRYRVSSADVTLHGTCPDCTDKRRAE
jgi:Fur family ferric uptake transcriptional regulator